MLAPWSQLLASQAPTKTNKANRLALIAWLDSIAHTCSMSQATLTLKRLIVQQDTSALPRAWTHLYLALLLNSKVHLHQTDQRVISAQLAVFAPLKASLLQLFAQISSTAQKTQLSLSDALTAKSVELQTLQLSRFTRSAPQVNSAKRVKKLYAMAAIFALKALLSQHPLMESQARFALKDSTALKVKPLPEIALLALTIHTSDWLSWLSADLALLDKFVLL